MKLYSISRAIIFGTALAMLASTTHADTPAPTPIKTKELASAPSEYSSVAGTDYRLHPFKAKDAAGHPLTDVPANIVDVFNRVGEWDAPKYSEPPAIAYPIPADIRDQIQLFYASGPGWVVVPKGWAIHRAAEGADGNAVFSFLSPKGREGGWLEIESIPACMGCMYSAADGIILGAHAGLEGITEDGAPEPTLVPKPESMTHPTACLAVFSYRVKPSLTVHAVVFLGHAEEPTETDEEGASLYIAMPDANAKLAEFIAGYFQRMHTDCAGVD